MKTTLRAKLLEQRLAISKEKSAIKSEIIRKKFCSLPESKKYNSFSVYLSINNEVETNSIINFLISCDKEVFLPKYSYKTEEYFLAKFSNWHELEKGPYKILQPKNNYRIGPKNLDVAIMPGVAFSTRGVRLGYGMGIFDKLFSNSRCLKIGLAYEVQILNNISKDDHDLSMDLVITEKKVYRFKTI